MKVVPKAGRSQALDSQQRLGQISSLCDHSYFFSTGSSSVQSLSHVWLFTTPRTVARQASLSITNSQSLLKLMSIKSMMPSNHFILCHPLPLLPSNLSQHQGLFQSVMLQIRWPKYWSFSFSISPSINIQDWFPLGLTGSRVPPKEDKFSLNFKITWEPQK